MTPHFVKKRKKKKKNTAAAPHLELSLEEGPVVFVDFVLVVAGHLLLDLHAILRLSQGAKLFFLRFKV